MRMHISITKNDGELFKSDYAPPPTKHYDQRDKHVHLGFEKYFEI